MFRLSTVVMHIRLCGNLSWKQAHMQLAISYLNIGGLCSKWSNQQNQVPIETEESKDVALSHHEEAREGVHDVLHCERSVVHALAGNVHQTRGVQSTQLGS